jgi:hypothetical protein
MSVTRSGNGLCTRFSVGVVEDIESITVAAGSAVYDLSAARHMALVMTSVRRGPIFSGGRNGWFCHDGQPKIPGQRSLYLCQAHVR